MTDTCNWIKPIILQAAPNIYSKTCPIPVYYYDSKTRKEYIIVTPHYESSNKCYKYDIVANEWIHFTSYPKELKPDCHCQAIDEENNLLYISHGHKQIFAVFNLLTNKWTVFCDKSCSSKYNIQYIANAPLCVLPQSELHLFAGTECIQHIRYDKLEKKWMTASKKGIENNSYLDIDELIFVSGKNILMVLGGYGEENEDKIWYTHYDDDETKDFEWKRFGIDLPEPSCSVRCSVAFGMVLILYICDKQKMCILDLDEKYKWIKPNINFKFKYTENTYIIVTKEHYLHFINQYESIHEKIHLSKFLPTNIYEKYVNSSMKRMTINDEEKCKCDEMREKMKSLEILVDDLVNNQSKSQREINELRLENKKLLKKNNKLNEECKESKLQLNNMQKELNKLKRLKNIDSKRYLQWTSDEIVDWIMTLEHGKYEQYENTLRMVFNQQSVNGEALPYVTKIDLQGWGIQNFMNRTNLYKHIENLKNQKRDIIDEGLNATAYI